MSINVAFFICAGANEISASLNDDQPNVFRERFGQSQVLR
ncbi:hypothetical protein RB6851 [Rhodopirellula baltica SH 1]|uniref:Uncharacterized protein n=1 Tax=Rhodopirellula baltica (strain DSM 10527 / NCIMB 13988 / SH1) TaxID=243090 RepID=Q7UPL8_RHOBA|nr:hypothetical protein RB6851 [Rhodopirellula baltica SH 1]